MIHPPTHLHYFSVATLSRLLDRHGLTWLMSAIPSRQFANNSRHRLYKLSLHAKKQSLYSKISGLPLLNLRLGNLYDIMYVIARRR